MPPKPSAKALGKRKATSPTPNPTPKPSKRVRKSNTKPTDEESSTPLPSTKTEVEIQILKAQAKKANPRGVRIANKNLESGGPALCGYLGLKDTNSLRHLLFESDVAEGILKRWRESRLLGFQVLERNETSSWQKSHIWNYVSKPGSLTEEQLAYDVPLPQDSSLMKDARGYASWVVTMYRLMEEIPECFEGDEIATDQTLAGRGFEDWNRAYEICRAYYRAHSVSRLGEAIEKKPQNKRAEAPIFLTSEDLAKVTSSDEAKLSADNLVSSLEQQDMDEALIDVEEGSAPMKTAELVEAAEDFNERFEQSFRHVKTPLNRIDAQNNRPRLNRDDQAALCAYIGKKASVLYPQGDAITLKSIEAVDLLGREQAQASLVEEALGDADKVSDRERKRFWALMTDLNRVTAPAPSYEKACQLLQLDPKSPTIDTGNKEPLKPYAWQIVAVAWLVGMEESVLGGGLLADDMGLGKTLVALLLIIFSANLRASRDGENPTVYRPTLIACPSSAYGTWKNEILKFCPTIPHRYYMGSPKQGSIVERARVLPTAAEELRKFVRSLSPTDPKTATTIILTTYTTWLKRTIHGDNSPGERPKRTHTAHDVDDDDDEPQEFSIEELNKLKSDCADLFDRVICDEAHKLKSDRTKTSRAIALLKAPRLIFMTATPMINKPMDLTGVLALLWKGSFMRKRDGEDDPAELEDFEEAKSQMTSSKLSADNLAEFVHLLDPTVYRRYAQPSGGAQMDAAISNTILPPILTLIQLRRTMSDQMEVMGKMVKVAAEVPPYRIVTVELRMTTNQADTYARIHKRLAGAIGAGSDEETGEGRMDQRVHRLLCHATFNSALHKIAEKAKTAVKNVNRWSE